MKKPRSEPVPHPARLTRRQAAGLLTGGLTLVTPVRPDVATAVAYGDAAIGPLWNGAGQAQATKMPNRFGVVLPSKGSPALPITVGLVKGVPQAEGRGPS